MIAFTWFKQYQLWYHIYHLNYEDRIKFLHRLRVLLRADPTISSMSGSFLGQSFSMGTSITVIATRNATQFLCFENSGWALSLSEKLLTNLVPWSISSLRCAPWVTRTRFNYSFRYHSSLLGIAAVIRNFVKYKGFLWNGKDINTPSANQVHFQDQNDSSTTNCGTISQQYTAVQNGILETIGSKGGTLLRSTRFNARFTWRDWLSMSECINGR